MGVHGKIADEAKNFDIQSRLDIQDMLNELDIQNQEPNEPSTWVLSPKYRRILIAVLSQLTCLLLTITIQAQNKGVLVLPQGEGAGGDSLGNVITTNHLLVGQGTNLATSNAKLTYTTSGMLSTLNVADELRVKSGSTNQSIIDATSIYINNDPTSTQFGNIFFATTGYASPAASIAYTTSFTGDEKFNFSSNGSLRLYSADSMTFRATTQGYYFLTKPTLDNDPDSVLVVDNVTNRIHLRSASTLGGGSPAGSTGEIQFNSSGSFGADVNLFWDAANDRLGIGTGSPSYTFHAYAAAAAVNTGIESGGDFGVRLRIKNTQAEWTNEVTSSANSGSYQIRDITNDKTSFYSTVSTMNVGFNNQKTFGTSAVGVLAIANGTAPTTSIADGVQIYAADVNSSSELIARDEAGNVTVLTNGGWNEVVLGSDFTISTTSNNNVTGLAFTPVANKRYIVKGMFLLRTATATVGARPGVAYPTGLTDAAHRINAPNSNTAEAQRHQGAISTANAASTGLPTTTDSYLSELDGILIVGGSPAGDFQITLASETAATNVTMKAGSILMYREY